MTKIKDLVTVITDGVVDAYPIDKERYELCVYMNQELNAAFGRQRDLIQITDGDLQEQYKLMVDYIDYALTCTFVALHAGPENLNRSERKLSNQTLRVPGIRESYYEMVTGSDATDWCIMGKYSILAIVFRRLYSSASPTVTVPQGQEG